MKQYQIEILKAYALVFSSMYGVIDGRQSKNQLDDKIIDAILTSQLILIGEFGSKSEIPEKLRGIAWTKENDAVVEKRWISRLCYASESADEMCLEVIDELCDELAEIIREEGESK